MNTELPKDLISIWQQSRWLEGALIFTIAIHAIAMLSMTLLLPGLPGGTQSELAARATYVADHPWLWRIGWFPWQVTALSDLLLGVALIATRWIPRGPAILGAIITCIAIIPDQYAQISWTTSGVSIAAQAAQTQDFAEYAKYESHTFLLTAGWGATGYTIGALAWTWCFAAAGIWSKWLKWLSVVTWGLFGTATAIAFAPEQFRTSPAVTLGISVGNALAFMGLLLWFTNAAELVMRRSRPDSRHGSHAPWRHPSTGLLPRLIDVVANSRLARSIGERLPSAAMSSDITDVVYINYLVEANALDNFVTRPLELQRLGPDGRYAMFSFLTYRHGDFGPSLFGRLRRLWPSPIQSNWRIYVKHPATGRSGIQFLTSAITSVPHALATRILAEGVPMHIPARAEICRQSSGSLQVLLDPGAGTSPDVAADLQPVAAPVLQGVWSECFASWHDMLKYCVPQDRAMCVQAWTGNVIRQEISLAIPLETCRPMEGNVTSSTARAIVGEALPLSFVVDRVGFQFAGEVADC